MNILIAATQLRRSNGGVCTHIIDLCKTLTKTEKVVLVADGTDFLEQINSIPGLTYVEIPFYEMDQSKKAIFKCYKMMRRLCKEHKIQIIHLHGQRVIPVAWMLRLRMGIPFLWTNHINAIPNQEIVSKMWKIMRFPIISVSADLKKQLINGLGIKADKITVVNNGVDLSTLTPLTNEERIDVRKRFGVKPDTFVISEVARLMYVKGQHLLVRAVAAAQEKYPDIEFQVLLAGNVEELDRPWMEDQINYLTERGIECRYLGFCKPRDVYGVTDLSVLPSKYEGFPLSSVEALAMGCPVLRSMAPGSDEMKDIVLLCKVDDLEDLTVKLEYAITHKEEMQEMASRGQKMVAERFTKEVMCKETFAVYRRILGE